jgi:hypothetical protein
MREHYSCRIRERIDNDEQPVTARLA